MRLRLASLFVSLLVAAPAWAQYYPPQPPPPGYYPPQQPPPGYYPQQPPPGYYPPQPPPPRYYPPRPYYRPVAPARVFGFGTSLAGGNQTYSYDPSLGVPDCAGGGCGLFVVGDLSLYLPITRRFELQAWSPLLTMALSKNVGFGNEFFAPRFWGDVFLKIYIHGNSDGFFVAPGLGYWYWVANDGSGYNQSAVQIPFRIGFDIASPGRGFALSLAARPWIDIITDTAGDNTVGVGGLFEAQVNFYITR